MTDIERRALLGDTEAQRECTEKGIVLRCPLCGSIYTQVRHMGWSEPAQAFEAGYRGECTVCHAVSGAHTTEKEALADWNRRPAPPIGRCGECKHSTNPAALTMIYGEPGTLTCHHGPCNRRNVNENDFCSYFEPKED